MGPPPWESELTAACVEAVGFGTTGSGAPLSPQAKASPALLACRAAWMQPHPFPLPARERPQRHASTLCTNHYRIPLPSQSCHHCHPGHLLPSSPPAPQGLMKTPAGRRIAEQRHAFMESYLTQFHDEWAGHA